MTKRIKDKWINTRIDAEFSATINAYIEKADDMTMGLLIRKAIKEFMANHPLTAE